MPIVKYTRKDNLEVSIMEPFASESAIGGSSSIQLDRCPLMHNNRVNCKFFAAQLSWRQNFLTFTMILLLSSYLIHRNVWEQQQQQQQWPIRQKTMRCQSSMMRRCSNQRLVFLRGFAAHQVVRLLTRVRTPSAPLPHQHSTLIVDGSLQLAIITKLIISVRQSGNKAPGRYSLLLSAAATLYAFQ